MSLINSLRPSRFFGYALVLAALTSPISAKPWKGAEVISKQTFRYGAFEARIQAAKGGGVITPFFLWKDGSEVAGAQWQEQDFEIFGRDGMFQTQVMTPGEPRTEHIQMHYPATPAYERYNTYRMEWTPDSVCFYFNGFLIRKETDKVEFSKLLDPARAERMQLRVSNWAGDGLWSGRFDSTALPADVYVNWIQTYAYTPGTGPEGSNFTSLWRDDFDTWNEGRWWTANWTFEYAVNDYVSRNAKVIDGALNLALTHWSKEGTFRPVPPDDGLTPPLRPGPVDPPEDPVYDTVPVVVPARLSAGQYARAFETIPGNEKDAICTSRNPNVDLEVSPDTVGGVCYISSTWPTEWLEYDIQVDSAQSYEIGLRLASARQSKNVVVFLDSVALDTLEVPSSGWQSFQTVFLPAVTLSAGKHTLRVLFQTGETNLHYIDVLPVASEGQTIDFLIPVSPTYGTEFVVLSATSTSGLPVRFASANPVAVRVSADTAYLLAADTATITASQPGDSSFLAAPTVSRILTVAKKALTIADAKASNKIYDGTIAATISDATLAGVVGADGVSLVLGNATFATKDTGTAKTVTVTGSTLSGAQAGNYNLSQVTGLTANITPMPITVTVAAKTKVYGAVDPSLTYTSSGHSNGDVFTGSLARMAGDSVGKYAIGQGTLSAGGNYALTFTGDSLTITPMPITVTVAGKTKVYGSVDPVLTYTATALSGTDVFTGSIARSAGDSVGKYAIGQGTLSAGGNYALTFTGDSLTITPMPITVTAAAKTKVYGAVDPALTYASSPLSNGDVFTGNLARMAGDSVGKYAISQGTLSAGRNYAIAYTGDSLSITPKAITVTAAAKAKVYGAADPVLTYTASALSNGDVFTGNLARMAGDSVGRYAISQGTLSAGRNYALTFTGDSLTITPMPITVTVAGKTKVYGAVDPALTYASSPLSNGDVFTGNLARMAGDSVGKYAISQGTLSAGRNYAIAYTGDSLTITPMPITVTAAAKTKVYGSTDPTLTYTATALVGPDTLSGALTREAGERAGTYPIRQGTLAAGRNYQITFAGADFTITQSTSIAARPVAVRSILSQQLEARAPRTFASPSTRSGAARMESFVCDADDVSCLSVDVLLPGASRVSVAIFDNLGVPVITFERDLSRLEFNRLAGFGDGRRVLPVSWNLRAKNGAAVEPGVFLWWIVVEAADGQKLETVKKLGVKRR